jgi:hypothetical protein
MCGCDSVRRVVRGIVSHATAPAKRIKTSVAHHGTRGTYLEEHTKQLVAPTQEASSLFLFNTSRSAVTHEHGGQLRTAHNGPGTKSVLRDSSGSCIGTSGN